MIPIQLQGEVEKVTNNVWLAESHPCIQRDLQYFSAQDTGEHAGESLGTQCVIIDLDKYIKLGWLS